MSPTTSDSNATCGVGYTPTKFAEPEVLPRLELRAVLVEGGRHYVLAKAHPAEIIIPLDSETDLHSFRAFADRAQAYNGLAFRHPLRSWRAAVEAAKKKGAAA